MNHHHLIITFLSINIRCSSNRQHFHSVFNTNYMKALLARSEIEKTKNYSLRFAYIVMNTTIQPYNTINTNNNKKSSNNRDDYSTLRPTFIISVLMDVIIRLKYCSIVAIYLRLSIFCFFFVIFSVVLLLLL